LLSIFAGLLTRRMALAQEGFLIRLIDYSCTR
jgi:hypothetical protein